MTKEKTQTWDKWYPDDWMYHHLYAAAGYDLLVIYYLYQTLRHTDSMHRREIREILDNELRSVSRMIGAQARMDRTFGDYLRDALRHENYIPLDKNK